MTGSPLDDAVSAAIADLAPRALPRPDAFIFLGTGMGMMPGRLAKATRVPLGRVAGVPGPWKDGLLYAGMLGETPVWMLEDAAGPPEQGTHEPLGEPPWVRGFPCWLAAAAGAPVCLHASAGMALDPQSATQPRPRSIREKVGEKRKRRIQPGSLVLVRDHINLSGRTPLLGLGESKLGPLFPDQSRLHLESLRKRALAHGKQIGVPVVEAVAACTIGPALETAAERVFWGRAGADVAVQDLATPLLSCAHAGLAVLAIVCVTDEGEGIGDVASMVMRADQMAPALEDLIVALAPDLQRAANELGVEEE